MKLPPAGVVRGAELGLEGWLEARSGQQEGLLGKKERVRVFGRSVVLSSHWPASQPAAPAIRCALRPLLQPVFCSLGSPGVDLPVYL